MQLVAIETKVALRLQLVILRGNFALLYQKLGPVFSWLLDHETQLCQRNITWVEDSEESQGCEQTAQDGMSLMLPCCPGYWVCGESPWPPWPPSDYVKLAQPSQSTHNSQYSHNVPCSWHPGCWWDYQGLSMFPWGKIKGKMHFPFVFHFHFMVRTNKKIARILRSWCSIYKVCCVRSKTSDLKKSRLQRV